MINTGIIRHVCLSEPENNYTVDCIVYTAAEFLIRNCVNLKVSHYCNVVEKRAEVLKGSRKAVIRAMLADINLDITRVLS